MHRILFADDGDIATMHGLRRVIHPAQKMPDNPVVVPDHPWEERLIMGGTVRLELDRGYRMWYQSYGRGTYLNLYAESEDGIHWSKPVLSQYEDFEGGIQNNIFLSRLALRSETRGPVGVNQDHNPNVLYTPHIGEEHRYTLISYDYARSGYAAYDGYFLAFSPDGLHWSDGPQDPVIPGHADVGWFTFDEAHGIFRAIVKNFLNIRGHRRRSVFWTESTDGYDWILPWLAVFPDGEDEAWTEGRAGYHTQFYGMPIFRYESMLLGLLQVFRVTSDNDGEIDVQLTCSRDGREWARVGDRRPILELGEPGTWDAGMVLAGNAMVVHGDRVCVYYSGSDHTHGERGQTQIGMAFWPRDRLVGLRASAQGGVLHTVPHMAGRHLHINADASGPGEIVAELVEEDGRPMAGYGASNAEPLRTDALDHTFRWRDASHGPTDRAAAVRLHITRAEVFSMWWD
jgi:hypothetical protein